MYLLPIHGSEQRQAEGWEIQWKKRADASNMKTGRYVFLVLVAATGYRLYRTVMEDDRGASCVPVQPRDESLGAAIIVQATVFVGAFIALIKTFREPDNKMLYAGVLVMWYLFVTMLAFWPFTPACTQYIRAFVSNFPRDTCSKEMKEHIYTTLINMDCTIQGHTITQVLMIWILCSYFFIPAYGWMKWNWAYLFLCYLPANLCWYAVSQDALYEPWDMLVSLIYLCLCQCIATARKYFLEKSQRSKAKLDFLEKLQARAMLISLKDQLPEHVISPLLSRPGEPYAHHIPCVSILFIMIDDFDAKARSVEVQQLLEFLNITFSRWDSIMLDLKVTIIETVREEYVCAVGVLPEHEKYGVEQHGVILRRLLLAAIEILKEQTDEVKVKMGIHTGEIFTGVIGQKLPRFRLFGDVINTTARMMQKSPVGMLQFGEETHRYVDAQMMLPSSVSIVQEKGVYMKGKGAIDVYRLSLDPASSGDEGEDEGESFGSALVLPRPTVELRISARVSAVPTAVRKQKSVSALDFAMRRMRTGMDFAAGHLHLPFPVFESREAEEEADEVRARRSMRHLGVGGQVSRRPSQKLSLPRVVEEPEKRGSVTASVGSASLGTASLGATSVGFLGSAQEGRTESKKSERGKGGGLRFNNQDEVVEVEARRRSIPLPTAGAVMHGSTDGDSSGDELPDGVAEELSNPPRTLMRGQTSYLSQLSSDGGGVVANDWAEEEEEERRLNELMKEVSKARSRGLAFWKKVVSFGLRTGFFSDELEREWFTWQHQNLMCNKLKARLARHQMALLLSTALDAALFCHFFKVFSIPWEPHRLYGDHPEYRMPVFLCCRLLCYLMLSFWKELLREDWRSDPQGAMTALPSHSYSWFYRQARLAQLGLLLSYQAMIFLMFISYDAVSNVQENWITNIVARWGERDTQRLHAAFHERMQLHWRQSGVNAFMFVLAAYALATSHPWPFYHCMTFPLTMLLFLKVYRSDFWVERNHSSMSMYFSSTGFVVIFSVFGLLFSRTSFLLERDSRGRFKAIKKLEATRGRFEDILSRLMPPQILDEMNDAPPGEKFPSHPYKCCTVVQSDLSGFTALASTRKPAEVVQLVSDLFGRFDTDADRRGVWKVETVGDAYIAAAAEPPLTSSCLAINVVVFGQDMIRQVHAWAQAHRIKVTCRVGAHHGECIGGIASSQMRRYHLFGDLMGIVEVLESTGALSRVQVSPACKAKVEQELRSETPLECEMEIRGFREREEPALFTSKGEQHSYDEVGGRTYLVDFKDELPEEPELDYF